MSATSTTGHRSRLEDLPAAGLIKARVWDVLGTALGAPMIVWGLLSWFGVAGDEGGGVPGFFSGAGAAAIGLVLAASGYSLNQILSGRPHETPAPPVSAFLATGAAIVVLGAMIAKPDSSTIEAGSIAGLITSVLQAVVLTLGWVKGSGKTVRANRLRALAEREAEADRVAQLNQAQASFADRYGPAGYGPGLTWGRPLYGSAGFGQAPFGQPRYGPQSFGPVQQPFGQPPFGQPPFGQPPFGQPPFGQPPFGQPQYGQPQFGQTQFGQPPGWSTQAQSGQPQTGQPPSGPN